MKYREGPSSAVRIRVMKRDRFQCTYCGAPGTDVELEVDHIVPVAKGGSHHMSNLTTACRACNQKKSDDLSMKPAKIVTSHDGPIGLFIHVLSDDGLVENQGHIIGHDSDNVFVELFSWITGAPTVTKVMRKEFVYSDACRLYASNELMIDAYDNEILRMTGVRPLKCPSLN